MTEVSPCKDCAERHEACWGSCDKYAEWKARHTAQQKHLADNRYRFNIPMTASREKRDTRYINHPVTGYKGGTQ